MVSKKLSFAERLVGGIAILFMFLLVGVFVNFMKDIMVQQILPPIIVMTLTIGIITGIAFIIFAGAE